MKDYLCLSDEDKFQTKFTVSKTSKINQLISESKFGEALKLVDEILKNDSSFNNWILKGKILDKLSQYDEAIKCFDNALALNESGDGRIAKANSLYNWAKITYFPEHDFKKALQLIDSALKTLPDSQDFSEFYFLKAEILESSDIVESKRYYLMAYGEFDKLKELDSQIEYLNNNDDTLIIITGSYFYNFVPESDLVVNLVREEDNEYDADAVAVYYNAEKIGYVANSEYTLINTVKSASDIKNQVLKNSNAEILFIYLDEYVIAKCLF